MLLDAKNNTKQREALTCGHEVQVSRHDHSDLYLIFGDFSDIDTRISGHESDRLAASFVFVRFELSIST